MLDFHVAVYFGVCSRFVDVHLLPPQQYRGLVDDLLATHLKEIGVTEEQFAEACEKGANNPMNMHVFNTILAADDFTGMCVESIINMPVLVAS